MVEVSRFRRRLSSMCAVEA